MKKIPITTLLLLFLLVITRVSVRNSASLWTDELEQIKNLTSVSHLIFEYLPNIPAGWPGHYLLTLPIQMFFPYNKFLLGLPGLLSHIGVFLLIPKVLSGLFAIKAKHLAAATLIARILFIIDPFFTFQSMEVRPYALLPFIWILCALMSVALVNEKWKILSRSARITKMMCYAVFYFAIFAWHLYGFIMTISILVYLLIVKLQRKKAIKYVEAGVVLFISLILVIPLWMHFSQSSSQYILAPFEMFPSINEIISGKRGIMTVYSWQHAIFLLFAAWVLLAIVRAIFSLQLTKIDTKALIRLIFSTFTLVAIPICIIVVMDIVNPYWILYRQFAWTALPAYLILALVASRFSTRNNKEIAIKHAQEKI